MNTAATLCGDSSQHAPHMTIAAGETGPLKPQLSRLLYLVAAFNDPPYSSASARLLQATVNLGDAASVHLIDS